MADRQEDIMQTVAVVGFILRWTLDQALETASKVAYNDGAGGGFFEMLHQYIADHETDPGLASACLASIESPPEQVEKVLNQIWEKMSTHCVQLFEDAQKQNKQERLKNNDNR